MHSKYLLLAALLRGTAALAAPAAAPGTPAALTDPAYRLNPGDHTSVSIFGESDLAAQQMIDHRGQVRLPLIGALPVAGLTVREAEELIEKTYREQEMLRQPQVTLSVSGYAPREVTVLGAVRGPGTFQFPPDATSLDIRDVIARQGGFSPVARSDSVAVTRRQPDGGETTTVIDVARLMSRRARDAGDIFYVLPGDRLFIPERLF